MGMKKECIVEKRDNDNELQNTYVCDIIKRMEELLESRDDTEETENSEY